MPFMAILDLGIDLGRFWRTSVIWARQFSGLTTMFTINWLQLHSEEHRTDGALSSLSILEVYLTSLQRFSLFQW